MRSGPKVSGQDLRGGVCVSPFRGSIVLLKPLGGVPSSTVTASQSTPKISEVRSSI